MANDIDLAIPRQSYYYVPCHKIYMLRTYNHEDMLIYIQMSTLMTINKLSHENHNEK